MLSWISFNFAAFDDDTFGVMTELAAAVDTVGFVFALLAFVGFVDLATGLPRDDLRMAENLTLIEH